MLSSIISKKRNRDEISSDHFDVYVPQNKDFQKDDLVSKFSRILLNNSSPLASNGFKVYFLNMLFNN